MILFPKQAGEPIERFARRLAAAFTNPDSTLWKNFRDSLYLSKREWLAAYDKPDDAFPYPHTIWDINCGHCESFCELLEQNFPGGEETWLDTLAINDGRVQPNGFPSWTPTQQQAWCETYQAPAHCVYLLNGKFYDSQNPEGVRDWMKLETWRLRKTTRTEWLKTQKT